MTKTDERKKTLPGGALLPGAGLGAAALTAVLLLGAVLIRHELISSDAYTPIICVGGFTGAFVSGMFTAKRAGKSYVLNGLYAALVLFAVRTVLAAIVSHGSVLDSSAAFFLASLVCGGFFGGLLSSHKRKRRRKQK